MSHALKKGPCKEFLVWLRNLQNTDPFQGMQLGKASWEESPVVQLNMMITIKM